MATAKITSERLHGLKLKTILWDSEIKGFGARRGSHGVSFIFKCREPKGGKQVLMTVGRWGKGAFSLDDARRITTRWALLIRDGKDPRGEPNDVAEKLTVSGALANYVADYTARGGKDVKGMTTVISAHIAPKLGESKVADLTSGIIRTWHRGLATTGPRLRTSKKPGAKPKPSHRLIDTDDADGQRARRASANRILTVLKAALNLAYTDGKAASPEPWRLVKPFMGVDAPRIRDVTETEIKRLVNSTNEYFRPMVKGALLSGARYGELVKLRVADLNASAGTLHIRPGKTNKARDVALNDEGLRFFKLQTEGKAGSSLMLPQPNGKAWGKSFQTRPIKAACVAAEIEPAISFHILRHVYASRLVQAGVPLGAVAKQIGDSEVTTAKHYAHHSPASVADSIRGVARELGIVLDTNVASIVG